MGISHDDTRDEFLGFGAIHWCDAQPLAHTIRPLPVEPPLPRCSWCGGLAGYPPLAVGRDWRDLVDTVDFTADGRADLRAPGQATPSISNAVCASSNFTSSTLSALPSVTRTGEGRNLRGRDGQRSVRQRAAPGQVAPATITGASGYRPAHATRRMGGIDPAAHVSEQLVRQRAGCRLPAVKLRARPHRWPLMHEFYRRAGGLPGRRRHG